MKELENNYDVYSKQIDVKQNKVVNYRFINEGTNKRYCWIDWMKVFGMILIVWGHMFPCHLSDFIYTFNVSLFFIVSGYLTSYKSVSRKAGGGKILVSLVIPYLCLSTFKLVIYFCRMLHNDLLTSNIVLNSIQAILLGQQGLNVHGTGCGPLWFVYTLIILKVITLLIRNRKLMYIISALGLMGAVLLNHAGFGKDWAITNTLLAFPCFAFGLFLSSYKDKVVGFMETYRDLNFVSQLLLILTFVIITYAISKFNGSVRMFQCNYGNSPFLFLLGTLSGSIAVGLISMSLDKVRLRSISIISSGNIIILAFHLLILGYICAAIMKIVPYTSWAFDLISLLASILLVLCFIPVIIIFGKFIPIALGRII